jgi:hypothetical protein
MRERGSDLMGPLRKLTTRKHRKALCRAVSELVSRSFQL